MMLALAVAFTTMLAPEEGPQAGPGVTPPAPAATAEAPVPAAAPEPAEAPAARALPAEAPPVAQAPPVAAPVATPQPTPSEDRIDLRDGGMLIGRVVAVQKGNYVTIVLANTGESRTVSWALIDAYRVAGEPEQIASRGKPTIAALAAESDSIERQKNIGLGLLYGGYVGGAISLGLWTATGVSTVYRDDLNPMWTASVVSTAITAGLLIGGGVMFFKSKRRRAELRKVQISGTWMPGGGGLQLHGRF